MKIKQSLAVLVLAALPLTACGTGMSGGGGGDEAPSEATKTGPITIWLSNNEQELGWGKAAVKAWNDAHPDQKVTAQEIPAAKSSEEAITAAITAGTAPCLVYNIAPAAAPQWQRQGGLVDLTTFPDGQQYIAARSGPTADQYGSDGHFYQLPWKSNPVMIMYNKDLFKKAGIDPDNPDMATYDTFLAGAKKLKDSGVEAAIWPSPTSEFYQPWFDFYPLYLAQTGGTPLVKDGAATFNSEDGKAVMNFWKQIYAEGLAPKEAATDDAMTSKKAAMQSAGPWAIATYKGAVNAGYMPVPTRDGKPADQSYTFADSKNISMFTTCQNQGTAWEFMKFTTSQEQDGDLLDATGQMPLRTDLPTVYADYFAKNKAYTSFADQASRTVDVPNVNNSIEVWQTFRDQYSSSVIFGKTPVDQALTTAADKINSLVKD